MLITACTDCGARFRVTPEQLNLRQGAVKCGSCGHVFNGFETLEQIPDEQFANFREVTSDPGPQQDATGEPDMPELESINSTEPVRASDPEFEAEIERLSAPPAAETPPVPREPVAPTPAPVPYAIPERKPAARPSRLWGLGAMLLFLVLVAQVVYEYRAQLATSYPDLRAPLQAACERLGCTVPWHNDELAVKLEDSELLEVPGQPGQITLSTRIRNLSDHPQEYPLLQLTLTDIDGQASVRRVFSPSDYLGRALKPGDAMPARGDTLVSVRLEARRVKPTGYELLLFYP